MYIERVKFVVCPLTRLYYMKATRHMLIEAFATNMYLSSKAATLQKHKYGYSVKISCL